MKATLILSIYKNVAALQAILHSLQRQTEQDFELILSEDGESQEMEQFIQSYSFPWPMQHLTQEDSGWHKNKSLNRAIVASHTDWLIFVDGDCVLHPRFIEEHIQHRAPHTILAGKRVKLNADLSKQLMAGQHLRLFSYLWRKRGCSLVEEGFYCPFLHFFRQHVKHLTGSNMSMSKEDIVAINGFDEEYQLPAIGEDFDIEWRLQANGCRIVSLRNLAVQYHLYHPENWTDDTVNMTYFRTIQQQHQIICRHGIQKD